MIVPRNIAHPAHFAKVQPQMNRALYGSGSGPNCGKEGSGPPNQDGMRYLRKGTPKKYMYAGKIKEFSSL